MFELAAPVLERLSQGRPVSVARVMDSRGFSSREPAAAVALDERGPVAGQILAGAADNQLAELAGLPGLWSDDSGDFSGRARIVEVSVSEPDALGAGLSCGGSVRLLIQDARGLGEQFWQLLVSNQPCVIVSELDSTALNAAGGDPGPMAVRTVVGQPGQRDSGLADAIPAPLLRDVIGLVARGSSLTALIDHDSDTALVTVLWPTPSLVVVGDGLIAEALTATARLLGWQPSTFSDSAASDAISKLAPGDAVVVLSHDLPLAGPALRAALEGSATYVGALGSRRTQSKRRDWLAEQGMPTEVIDRIHGPAGLDLGALTPAEIAIAIAAEMLAVRTGSDARPLREGTASIHRGRSVMSD